MKTCSKCLIPKEEEAFPIRKETGRLRTVCQKCDNARHQAARINNPSPSQTPEARRAASIRYRLDNKDRLNAYNKEYYHKTPRCRKKIAESQRKRIYGLAEGEFDRLKELQLGVCAICKKAPTKGKSLHVDHDHKTGKVRGLLCPLCNVGLGSLQDSEEILVAALAYLRRSV